MIWLGENRAAIKDELLTTNPDAKVTDVTKRAGALWKELADSEKAPFQTQADTLREQYYEQMKHYQPTYTAPSKIQSLNHMTPTKLLTLQMDGLALTL